MNNRTVVEKYIELYNSKQVEPMLVLFSENAVFESVSNSMGTTRTNSKEELHTLALSSLDFFAERKLTAINWIIDGDNIAIEITYWCRLAQDFPNGLKAGEEMNLRGTSFFTIKNGYITKLVDYM